MRYALLATLVLVPVTAFAQAPPPAAACERLASLVLPNATIASARMVDAGAFEPPPTPAGGGGASGPVGPAPIPAIPGRVTGATAGLGLGYNGGRPLPRYSELPAFCRVTAALKPSPSSDIRMELWLPAAAWNGHFRGTSPNGLGGSINYTAMGVGLRDGFAVASTDTGHVGGSTAWMLNPEKVTDFAGRAMHETTVVGKALAAAYFGTSPRFSYMIECGGGTNAAMHELQKYPADYNGIVIGGFAAYLTRQIFGQMWAWLATHQDQTSAIPAAKLPVIHDAVLAKCDRLDGVKDGLLEDPTRCTFDPGEIECRGADAPNCLTAAQVATVRKLYAGPRNPRTNEKIHSRLYRGSELDWDFFIGSANPIGIATGTLRDAILKDATWDFRKTPIDFDRDVARADQSDIARVNAFNPDIAAYLARGGKLILTGGWNNALVPPEPIVDYYTKVEATVGSRSARNGVRLYMIPGMSECNGGPGTDTFDMLAAMRRWVERNQPPSDIIASRVENGKVVRTRPLCPYPQVATYEGAGSTDEAANFVCR